MSSAFALRASARQPSLAGLPRRSSQGEATERSLERETGIEPATNSLEGCDSTTELLPPSRLAPSPPHRFGVAGPRTRSSLSLNVTGQPRPSTRPLRALAQGIRLGPALAC